MAEKLLTTAEIARSAPGKAKRADIPNSGLGLDTLALVTGFLIIVTFHIQNPILNFETQFGSAFRNATLQPVLAVLLMVCSGMFIVATNAWRTLPGKIASVAIAIFAIYALLAIVLDINLSGILTGAPQALFLEELEDEAPRALFETAITLSMVLEIAALIGVIWLWSPWDRLPVYARFVRRNAPVLGVLVLVLFWWEVLIIAFRVQEFFLPKPSTIAATFIEIYPRLVTVGWNTFQNAFWGFVVGCGLGFLTGLVSARFVSFSRALLPLAIAANSVPVIAFAPIINNWFGALNPASKIAIVAILTYFPAMISTVRGLNSVMPLQLELMRSYAASDFEIFRKVRLPSSLPFVFSALKVATTLSMIGAIVSEYFGGTTQGLGYRIREDASNFKYPEAWAAIIVASLLGILFYVLVSAVERAAMPWHVSFRDE